MPNMSHGHVESLSQCKWEQATCVQILTETVTLPHPRFQLGFLMGRQKLFFSLLSTLESGLKGRIQCSIVSSYSSRDSPLSSQCIYYPYLLFVLKERQRTSGAVQDQQNAKVPSLMWGVYNQRTHTPLSDHTILTSFLWHSLLWWCYF